MKQGMDKRGKDSQNTTRKFKQRVDEVTSRPVTKRVRLVYESCCGCGCTDVNIYRTVPFESALKDGSRISRMEDGDSTTK